MQLNGKVALVTGAGQGLGKAVALRLASLGSNVVAADINEETARQTAEEVQRLGVASTALRVDVSDVGQVMSMADAAMAEMGAVDILVASAGVAQAKSPLAITEDDWDFMFEINAKGTFFSNQAVLKHMCARRSGAIVNIASIAGRGPRPNWAAYAASKAAVISVTKSLAAAVGCFGIKVNAVCPGVIATPMWDKLGSELGVDGPSSAKEAVRAAAERSCLAREETAEDVAGAVAFLVSDDGSYITGQALNVDGGIEMN